VGKRSLNESLIEVTKTKERLDLSFISWCFPICNSGDFDGIHADLAISDNDAKVLGFLLIEHAFVQVEVQLVFTEDLHYAAYLCMMFTKHLGEDEDIVDINDDLAIVNLNSENLIHHGLKHGR
jgi:hypothetical protein